MNGVFKMTTFQFDKFFDLQKFLTMVVLLKVAFSQKGLMRLSFLQIDEPNYFPELEF